MADEAARDDKGLWLPGQRSPNPRGRATRKTEEKYLKAMVQCVTVDDWMEVVEQALADAKEGKASARNWLSNYLIGKPKQQVRIEGMKEIVDKTDEVRTLATVLEAVLRQQLDNGDQAVVMEGEYKTGEER